MELNPYESPQNVQEDVAVVRPKRKRSSVWPRLVSLFLWLLGLYLLVGIIHGIWFAMTHEVANPVEIQKLLDEMREKSKLDPPETSKPAAME